MNDINNDLQYNKSEILSGIKADFAEEENSSEQYDPLYLTTPTPKLAAAIKKDLEKPTITEQLNK